jgi:hypothetical protein
MRVMIFVEDKLTAVARKVTVYIGFAILYKMQVLREVHWIDVMGKRTNAGQLEHLASETV